MSKLSQINVNINDRRSVCYFVTVNSSNSKLTQEVNKFSNLILNSLQKSENRVIDVTEVFYIKQQDISIFALQQNVVLSEIMVTNVSLVGTNRISYPSKGPKITGSQSNSVTIFTYTTFLLPAPMITGVVSYKIYPKKAPNQAIIIPFKGIVTKDLTFNLGFVYNYNIAKYTINYFDFEGNINDDENIFIDITLDCPLTPNEVLTSCSALEGHLNKELFNHESINGIATAIKDKLSELLTLL